MKRSKNIIALSFLFLFTWSNQNISAQQPLAQQAYALIEHHCLNCHGENGAFTEQLIIDHATLTAPGGAIIPGNPQASSFYQRLIVADTAKRMPLNAPPLSQQALETIRLWIEAGAPDWDAGPRPDTPFISHAEMLTTIENHLNSLPAFDRAFARYFSITHLYNAGETPEALSAYQRALAKLINSLSWGRQVINPHPIDAAETLFYIDLRHYEWDVRDAWASIEILYPYHITFDAPTQTALREKLTTLQGEMNCKVPFVHVDWFLANASLPPLYHDILALPETDRELEDHLEVDVVRNLLDAPGVRAWRAGFSESGVSNHNRVVERHESRYGAYWKSYDFAGSAGRQNIITHPLNFQHDGGEVVFNLPNGLQGYYISDAAGNRIDVAPTDIVSNPAASDPAVRNGLSCIGCHTEGMKTFEDEVRGVVLRQPDSPVRAQVLRLYVEESEMDALVAADTARFREALEATGGVFGGIEPVQRFYEIFQGPVDASHAAAAVGLETGAFLQKVREDVRLQNLGLLSLEGANGSVKRDAWTEQFGEIVLALYSPDASVDTPIVPQTEVLPGSYVHIPDANLRAAIAEALGKAPNAPITAAEMAALTELIAHFNDDIRSLTGLEAATNLIVLIIDYTSISDLSPLTGLTKIRTINLNGTEVADLSPLAGLTKLQEVYLNGTKVVDLSPLASLHNLEVIDASRTYISDLAPLAGLTKLRKLDTLHSNISDLSPLAGLTNLTRLLLYDCKATDLSPLKSLTKLEWLGFPHTNNISDFSPLADLTNLKHLDLFHTEISDISILSGLINLESLHLPENRIADISSLASLHNLKTLIIHTNNIEDFSLLDGIRKNLEIFEWFQNPGFPQGGDKIEGPWLWLLLPQVEGGLSIDHLAAASGGEVTEQHIATFGATEGQAVGESVWLAGSLESYNYDNLRSNYNNLGRFFEQENAFEFRQGQNYVFYGSITLYSPREQHVNIFAGSSFYRNVWMNGELVIKKRDPVWPWIVNYQEFSPVTLKKGKNVLLISCNGRMNPPQAFFFGFEPGTEYRVSNPGVGYAFSKTSLHAGDTFTVDIRAKNFIDLAGWQFDIAFDPAMLEAIEVSEGDFLKGEGGTTFFQKGTINNTAGKITGLSAARIAETGTAGTGTLLSVTFEAKAVGDTQLTLQNFQFGDMSGAPIPAGPHEVAISIAGHLAIGDVNRDGQVSILDMILVAQQLGKRVPTNASVDVNGDGIVSVLDLILVSKHLGESTAAAPSLVTSADRLTSAMVQAWITRAQLEDDGSLVFREGIAKLQALLESLTVPDQTALLANYPNPFNPETWLPYQLSAPADVTLTIHAANGTVVRRLALGYHAAGVYQSRSRAAYWDGRNAVGEPVASGVYFYTLTAGNFTATQKMLIRK